jgi:hypothetical protein
MPEKKIAGITLKVDQPLASEVLQLQARLTRAAGGLAEKLPSILASAKEGTAPEVKQKAEKDAIAGIADIFSRLSPVEYSTLVGDIIALGKILRPSGNYEQADLDGDFSSNLGAIIPVCVYILKEVFGDFLSGARAAGSRAIQGKQP